MNQYVVGNIVTLDTLFKDENNILVDPPAVYLVVNKAGETVLTYLYGVGTQITRSATGMYSTELPLDTVGGWNYYWYSSGTMAANNGQFIVTPSGV